MLRVAGQAFVREAFLFLFSRGPTRAAIISAAVSRADAVTSTFAEPTVRWIAIAASEQ